MNKLEFQEKLNSISPETISAIEWGIVPLILIGIFVRFLIYSPERNTSEKIRNSSLSGKFAGLLIFVFFVLSQKNRELSFSFNMPVYEFNIVIVLFSIATGFIVSWLFNLIKKKIFIGLYTLISVASTSTAIYCYLFIENLRSYLVFVTIGIMLGILIYAIFFPKEATLNKKTT